MELTQNNVPICDAINRQKSQRIVSFDVPGHKQNRGGGTPDLAKYFGEQCLSVDMNSRKPLDNLCHPISAIRDAEILAAEAFGAKSAFLMVSGTTSAVQAMIMYSCKRGEKIIMPRNVHRSAINSLIVSGAIPVYVDPGVNKKLGIALGMPASEVEKAIIQNPDAKAIFVNNPTYYGICSDIKAITEIAHAHGMLVLADEAHGTHFYFGDNLPISALVAGADMAAVSMHKTGGSLTQSSFLFAGKNVHEGYLRQILNLTQTTSGSYLLMASLDIARRSLALKGRDIFNNVRALSCYAREEVNKIGGYYAFGKDLLNGSNIYDFDDIKLSIYTRDIGLAGIEVADILRDDYGLQVEFGDIGNILAIISMGDTKLGVERLVAALSEIKRLYSKDKTGMFDHEYITPEVIIAPQEAFYSNEISVPLSESKGGICGEFIMCYPPGIPILAPGERITADIIDYILYAKEKGCLIIGTEDVDSLFIKIIK